MSTLDEHYTEVIVKRMSSLDSDESLSLLKMISSGFVAASTMWAVKEAERHKDHGCSTEYTKDLLDGLLEAVMGDIHMSAKINCDLRGVKYSKEIEDPNEKVRDSILREMESNETG